MAVGVGVGIGHLVDIAIAVLNISGDRSCFVDGCYQINGIVS